MPKTDHDLEVVIVVSGVPRPETFNVNELLKNVVRDVLRDSGDSGRSPDDFELRTEAGHLLDLNARAGDVGLKDGDTLFLTPHAGAGG